MSQEVSALLVELEEVLRQEGHWTTITPSFEALSSQEPFCIDTLSVLEWLQWLYIPRLRAMIEHGSALPKGAQVHPYAEEALKGIASGREAILEVVARLDIAMR
ncbi:YqcC family protein [Parendozoicomonas haliclonae]|uniref:YqcC-like domain-containing protein n=1 Tax=Parendozoicomonas haliclonae TaxID=1960125 RepID=A0A1X7AIG9_9GAMM|nr:YqcC family protein [Parendozoicomonas haliclonae]SMA44820.1 hypothetical protein EHSB41UT_01804 [Parendozoicomonas haliclonae]